MSSGRLQYILRRIKKDPAICPCYFLTSLIKDLHKHVICKSLVPDTPHALYNLHLPIVQRSNISQYGRAPYVQNIPLSTLQARATQPVARWQHIAHDSFMLPAEVFERRKRLSAPFPKTPKQFWKLTSCLFMESHNTRAKSSGTTALVVKWVSEICSSHFIANGV